MEAKDKIIFAADVDNLGDLEKYLRALSGHIGVVKLGMEILTMAMIEGAPVIQTVLDNFAGKIMIDLKFGDIPRTVAGAAKVVARNSAEKRIFGFTIHCSKGFDMIQDTVKAVMKFSPSDYQPLVLGVTVLTSLSDYILKDEVRASDNSQELVAHYATLARRAGAKGIVCSPLETAQVLEVYPGCTVVNPGIRFAGSEVQDQKRVNTAGAAVAAGASYVVMGTDLRKGDPVTNARRAAEEIAAVM